VSECLSYSQSLPRIVFDHDLCLVMKFVYVRQTCCVAELNKSLKLELHVLKQLVCIFLWPTHYMCRIWARNISHNKWWMAFHLYPNCLVDSVETWISTNDEIHTITKDLYLNWAEFGLQTWLTATEGSSVLTLDIQPICYE